MPDAPGPDELAEIRARHVPWRDHRHAVCAECAHTWPCDAARLLALYDETAADLARVAAARDALAERAEAAEVRLSTKGGGTLVVTAAELDQAWREERAIAERARFWAAGWRRAAYDRRDRADLAGAAHEDLLARAAHAGMFPAEVAAVVAAARAVVRDAGWLDRPTVLGLHALIDALAALDAATQQG